MPNEVQRIARERIRILFDLAEKAPPERAERYVALARRIASRNRVHMPKDLRRLVCRGCKGYLNPSMSRTRVRQTREPHVATTCLRCGHVNRYPIRGRKD
jgi:ribonuclease P protein subunit RPR2